MFFYPLPIIDTTTYTTTTILRCFLFIDKAMRPSPPHSLDNTLLLLKTARNCSLRLLCDLCGKILTAKDAKSAKSRKEE